MSYTDKALMFDGMRVHYIEGGSGFPVLMIHGSGPGASTIGNWRLVLEPLAQRYRVFAMDLIGFGRSDRKPETPYFDMDLWLGQCRAMLDRIGSSSVGIIGHSISGALALRLAASDPRITKVLTTGAMGASFTVNEHTIRTWTFPNNRDELRRAAESLVYDKSLIDDAYIENRENVLFDGEYESYFSTLFNGDKQQYVDAAIISDEELAKISCDVMMLHGRDDLGFPAESLTLPISRSIAKADATVIGRCSHSIAMEHPAKLIGAADVLFGQPSEVR